MLCLLVCVIQWHSRNLRIFRVELNLTNCSWNKKNYTFMSETSATCLLILEFCPESTEGQISPDQKWYETKQISIMYFRGAQCHRVAVRVTLTVIHSSSSSNDCICISAMEEISGYIACMPHFYFSYCGHFWGKWRVMFVSDATVIW